ncbi:thioredoxin-like domain-containing protein [Pantanalinema sp. GBBB05]|uniref:thioredoxin-like domain-containing protein n=1 Tax=Pantanalinema sp. GBBB05 TaxID=2604139 RepID=UPI001DFEB5F6|nr:redoxin domain-containing protein [Pantanalinema sp. GBBB05]
MVRIRAPHLPLTLPWLNCDRPLSLQELRGQIVLLDFWTYGCINCLHVISDLHALAQKYARHLTIIGVHTAKFDQEQHLDSIRHAIWRYGITHPVVVDRDRTLWDQYAIRAYPTFVLIDPQGYIVTTLAGEGRRQILDDFIDRLIREHAGQETLSEKQLQEMLPPDALTATPLAFPGKVFAHERSDTLCIADTGHHRIVITQLDGTYKGAIGTGVAGWQDGDWEIAQFSAPQGMALDASKPVLYVADAGNHRLRAIDWQQKTVRTIAGTGLQNPVLFPQGGNALTLELNSPWDLVVLDNALYIAMAGSHQIWIMDLVSQTIQAYLGTGAEYCVDGSLEIAAFAQPHGMATDGTRLFVADSETSTIRAITPSFLPVVQTLCGLGELFHFGDRDGVGSEVQLQHCSGLVYARGFLWVADTYNHAIKRVHPVTGECRRVAGRGTPGLADGIGVAVHFSEPSGLSYAGDRLYIADTNNHAIRCLNLESLAVTTLSISGLCAPNVCAPT